jgi:hypothetical protein
VVVPPDAPPDAIGVPPSREYILPGDDAFDAVSIKKLSDTFEPIGHRPPSSLSPQDEALFRAFQSNLLSLISHEMRTPLMGVINALGLLDEGAEASGLSAAELIRMARSNARKLHETLSALLDLAALESKTFHARLREVDLARLAGARLDAHRAQFRERGFQIEERIAPGASHLVLADPQKLGRAIDLCLQALGQRAEPGQKMRFSLSSNRIEIACTLTSAAQDLWDTMWTQASAGFQGGVTSPLSAFAGVMQSEQAFLTRMEEGLGSEFLLVHEILKIHQGKLSAERAGGQATLTLELPELSSEEGLASVLASRAYEVSTELASVALVLVKLPEGARIAPESFTEQIKKSLFRNSDAVYLLRERGELALVLDDCKPEDAPRLMERINQKLSKSAGRIVYGVAQCPADGLDPALLMGLASQRLAQA